MMFSVNGSHTGNTLMRTMLVVLLCLCAQAYAAPSTGLIWEIRKGEQTSYLLGSVHFANAKLYPLSPAILKAYERSGVLLVEVDESTLSAEAQQALLMQYGLYPDGKSLRTEMSADTLAVIETQLAEFQIPLAQVERYRPGMLAVTLASMQAAKLGYSAEQGIDRYFMQKARYKKPIRQLEDFASQMALLGDLPEEDALVRDSFENMDDYNEMWHGMMRTWREGDAQGIYELAIAEPLREFPRLERFYEQLFFQRHPRMLAGIEECFSRREICFVVVGAGHAVGPRGLVADLKRKGYSVRQIKQ